MNPKKWKLLATVFRRREKKQHGKNCCFLFPFYFYFSTDHLCFNVYFFHMYITYPSQIEFIYCIVRIFLEFLIHSGNWLKGKITKRKKKLQFYTVKFSIFVIRLHFKAGEYAPNERGNNVWFCFQFFYLLFLLVAILAVTMRNAMWKLTDFSCVICKKVDLVETSCSKQ